MSLSLCHYDFSLPYDIAFTGWSGWSGWSVLHYITLVGLVGLALHYDYDENPFAHAGRRISWNASVAPP